jgi:hypothetical protein
MWEAAGKVDGQASSLLYKSHVCLDMQFCCVNAGIAGRVGWSAGEGGVAVRWRLAAGGLKHPLPVTSLMLCCLCGAAVPVLQDVSGGLPLKVESPFGCLKLLFQSHS